MIVLAVIGLATISLLLALPVLWAWRFAAQYPPRSGPRVPDDQLPRAAVLLAIRGADPSLRHCLEGLLDQDYPDYDVRIVVDNAEDPAWEIVREVLENQPGRSVKISLLEIQYETCSLKVSALLQAIKELDDSYGVVATIDADVVPHRTWLRDLAGPLADPRVGAATGVRWYLPVHRDLGTMVRHLWNAAAATQMAAFHIPWGGSMTYRAELFRTTNLLERWQRSFCEDASSARLLQESGLRLELVPAATMVNEEEIDLVSCCRFIRRQLLCTRLYHPNWPAVLGGSVGMTLALLVACGWLAVAVAMGAWGWAGCLAGILAGFGLGLHSANVWGQVCLQRQARQRGESTSALLLGHALFGIPVTAVVYFGCLMSACFLRQVDWRGVTYEVRGPSTVRLVEYQPYRPPNTASHRNASLV